MATALGQIQNCGLADLLGAQLGLPGRHRGGPGDCHPGDALCSAPHHLFVPPGFPLLVSHLSSPSCGPEISRESPTAVLSPNVVPMAMALLTATEVELLASSVSNSSGQPEAPFCAGPGDALQRRAERFRGRGGETRRPEH